eukprot:GSMAST32.ASY1.ANO1.2343.1 assembled CDS
MMLLNLIPWPIGNILQMANMKKGNTVNIHKTNKTNKSQERLDPAKGHWAGELLVRYTRLVPYLVISLISFQYTFPIERAKDDNDFSWVLIPLIRNVFVLNFLYMFWHYILYLSPWHQDERFREKKYNSIQQYEKSDHLLREVIYCNLGFLMSTCYECIFIRLWAIGAIPSLIETGFWSFPIWSIFHLAAVAYWRDFHFYFAHRVMHPWWNRKNSIWTGDIGAFLYRHFHSLHHKSYNFCFLIIFFFFGTKNSYLTNKTVYYKQNIFSQYLHPVEHFIYYSCTILALFFTLHPLHFYFNKFHADISPLPGHDGYDKPGGGSYFHYLHHAKFEVNYGTPMVPLDKLFGSFEDGSKYIKKK